MAQKHIDMNQAKQIQQLSADGVSIKEIVRRTGISRKTVRKYLRKIETIDHACRFLTMSTHRSFS
jgi:DNA-binding CsgD family transcriptional regulator